MTKQQRRKQAAAESLGEADHAGRREVVRGFILKLTGDPSLADDFAQETLLRAHKSELKFKGKASRTTWLCAIALNVMRDHFRAAARWPSQVSDPQVLQAVTDDADVEDEFLQDEMDACIRQYVLRLPESQSDVVALHDIAGFTHREVSCVLGISESNSRVLLHRGRAALKRVLEENCTLSFGDSVPCEPK